MGRQEMNIIIVNINLDGGEYRGENKTGHSSPENQVPEMNQP